MPTKTSCFSVFRARPLLLACVSEFGYRFCGSATSSINSTGHLLRRFLDLPAQVSMAPHAFLPKEPSPLAGAKESPWPFYQHHNMFSEKRVPHRSLLVKSLPAPSLSPSRAINNVLFPSPPCPVFSHLELVVECNIG